MATEVSGATGWPVLSQIERRILGVLVEKAKTTPDGYPLSLNALTTGCNQKSAREPVMNVSDDDVLEALPVLQTKGLVTRIQGGRVERYRHNLYDVWDVSKIELAILAELLLRGPQTEGELRGRASRMEPIDDLDILRAALKPLAERKLAVFLGEAGRRGTLIAHGFHDAKELDVLRLQQRHDSPTPSAPPTGGAARGENVETLQMLMTEAREEVGSLRLEVKELQSTVQRLGDDLAALKKSLGA
ncbi:MAG: DUF480 domain-containing protein [Gemmataceae bacterium]